MSVRNLAWMMLATLTGAMAVSCVGNSGDDNSNGSGNVCARAAAKLRSCGLATDGVFAECDEPEGPGETCESNCYLNAACSELQEALCNDNPTGNLLACADACEANNMFNCGGGETVRGSWQCDGEPDCSNGADEVGCPTFDCGNGETVEADAECNGFAQCSNSADEANCMTETFTCGGGETISAEWQCDGDEDCPDASDEDGCPDALELICN